MSPQSIPKATALKRMLAFVYDLFLIIPLMMLVTLIWLPFNHGVAIEPGHALYPLMITTCTIFTPIVFYTYFWHKGGQTLGMRSWRLRVVTTHGETLSPKISATRAVLFVLAIAIAFFGINYAIGVQWTTAAMIPMASALLALYGLGMAFFNNRTTFYDLWTQTRVVQLPKTKK
ncbi:RDD family protein [Wohlfahrtiimonas chitiniclastica]|uniref:RDD family protein n=1 Tax=Wohlfahrtiimonas chitiniclastica TaxID=400946 RepID=UPI0004759BA6|nr:RDD family protein [Wohlfahrtiimonas chitiniclastica]